MPRSDKQVLNDVMIVLGKKASEHQKRSCFIVISKLLKEHFELFQVLKENHTSSQFAKSFLSLMTLNETEASHYDNACLLLNLLKPQSHFWQQAIVYQAIDAFHSLGLLSQWRDSIKANYRDLETCIKSMGNQPKLSVADGLLLFACIIDEPLLLGELLEKHQARSDSQLFHYGTMIPAMALCPSSSTRQLLVDKGANVNHLQTAQALLTVEFAIEPIRKAWVSPQDTLEWGEVLYQALQALGAQAWASALSLLCDEMSRGVYFISSLKCLLFERLLADEHLVRQALNEALFNKLRRLIRLTVESSDDFNAHIDTIKSACRAYCDAYLMRSEVTPLERKVALCLGSLLDQDVISAVSSHGLNEDLLELETRVHTAKEFHRTQSGASDSFENLLHQHIPPKAQAFYRSVYALLSDSERCVDLLKDLECDLDNQLNNCSVDLAPLSDIKAYIDLDLIWPVLSCESLPQTHSLLHRLLLNKERSVGVNDFSNAPIIFAGFVKKMLADQLVREGHLFTEYLSAGDLLHGKYSHRLQWYIVWRGIDERLLEVPQGCSIKALFAMSPAVWTQLFDSYPTDGAKVVGFRSPHALHSSLMLMSEALPQLSAYLRKAYHASILQVIRTQSSDTLSVEAVILKNAVTGASFHSIAEVEDPGKHYAKGNNALNYRHQGHSYAVFFKQRGETFGKEINNDNSESIEVSKFARKCVS